tara:strand:- start:123 stop:1310 length:1188 start_codon:yes stop_codon:yes gene_type:complete
MKNFSQIFLLLIIFSCSQQDEFTKENVNSSRVVTGPFLIRNNLLYLQDTNELVQGTVEIYSAGNLSERKDYKNGLLDGTYGSYYPSGQLSTREIYMSGYKDGMYEMFWENGQLARQGRYKNGKEVGISKYYGENGDLYLKRHFNNSTSEVELEKTYTNSILTGRFEMKNGLKNGSYSFYRNNSILKEKGTFLDGYRDGVIEYFDEKQQLDKEVFYEGRTDILSVDYFYWDDGTLKSKFTNNQGSKNNNWKFFNKQGNLICDANLIEIKAFTLDGVLKGYYENGSPKFVKYYNNGVLEKNSSIYYDKNNDVIENGIIFDYYKDSNPFDGVAQLAYEYEIKNSLKNGFYQRWHSEGTLHMQGFFKDGFFEDGFEEYNKDGKLIESTSPLGPIWSILL